MLTAILIVAILAMLAAVSAASNTSKPESVFVGLQRVKDELSAEIDFARDKIEELKGEIFELRMEVRGVGRPTDYS